MIYVIIYHYSILIFICIQYNIVNQIRLHFFIIVWFILSLFGCLASKLVHAVCVSFKITPYSFTWKYKYTTPSNENSMLIIIKRPDWTKCVYAYVYFFSHLNFLWYYIFQMAYVKMIQQKEIIYYCVCTLLQQQTMSLPLCRLLKWMKRKHMHTLTRFPSLSLSLSLVRSCTSVPLRKYSTLAMYVWGDWCVRSLRVRTYVCVCACIISFKTNI